eukprot:403362031
MIMNIQDHSSNQNTTYTAPTFSTQSQSQYNPLRYLYLKHQTLIDTNKQKKSQVKNIKKGQSKYGKKSSIITNQKQRPTEFQISLEQKNQINKGSKSQTIYNHNDQRHDTQLVNQYQIVQLNEHSNDKLPIKISKIDIKTLTIDDIIYEDSNEVSNDNYSKNGCDLSFMKSSLNSPLKLIPLLSSSQRVSQNITIYQHTAPITNTNSIKQPQYDSFNSNKVTPVKLQRELNFYHNGQIPNKSNATYVSPNSKHPQTKFNEQNMNTQNILNFDQNIIVTFNQDLSNITKPFNKIMRAPSTSQELGNKDIHSYHHKYHQQTQHQESLQDQNLLKVTSNSNNKHHHQLQSPGMRSNFSFLSSQCEFDAEAIHDVEVEEYQDTSECQNAQSTQKTRQMESEDIDKTLNYDMKIIDDDEDDEIILFKEESLRSGSKKKASQNINQILKTVHSFGINQKQELKSKVQLSRNYDVQQKKLWNNQSKLIQNQSSFKSTLHSILYQQPNLFAKGTPRNNIARAKTQLRTNDQSQDRPNSINSIRESIATNMHKKNPLISYSDKKQKESKDIQCLDMSTVMSGCQFETQLTSPKSVIENENNFNQSQLHKMPIDKIYSARIHNDECPKVQKSKVLSIDNQIKKSLPFAKPQAKVQPSQKLRQQLTGRINSIIENSKNPTTIVSQRYSNQSKELTSSQIVNSKKFQNYNKKPQMNDKRYSQINSTSFQTKQKNLTSRKTTKDNSIVQQSSLKHSQISINSPRLSQIKQELMGLKRNLRLL